MYRNSKRVHILLLGFFIQANVCAEVVLEGNLTLIKDSTNQEFSITEDLGQTSGDNLYHGFESFSISAGETATFSGSSNIKNIISRVSGNNASNIDGTLRSTIDGANLWLLNPNGVLFGENASLDITGSFYSSTADYLKFDNDDQYFTDTTNQNSTLSSSNPTSFGFLSSDTSSIVINNSELSVSGSQSINVVGGAINLYQAEIGAEEGEINVVANRQINEIDLASLNSIDISVDDYADININESSLTVSGTSNQGISIIGGKLVIADSQISENSNSSQLSADIQMRSDVLVLSNTEINTFEQSNIKIVSNELVVRDVNALEDTGIIDASLNIDNLKVLVENANDDSLSALMDSIDPVTNVSVSVTGEIESAAMPINDQSSINDNISNVDSQVDASDTVSSDEINSAALKSKRNEFDFGEIQEQSAKQAKVNNHCSPRGKRQLLSTRQVLFQPMPGEFNPGSLYQQVDLSRVNDTVSDSAILGIFSQCS